MAASQERIAEEIRNFPAYMTKVTGLQTKKSEKRIHGLGWRLPVAATKEDNLDWLKRCSEKFL